MFELALPWWEFVVRGSVVYFVVLAMVRMSGKRAVGQYTPFDMLLLIMLGAAAQNSLIADDYSLLGGLIVAATLVLWDYLIAALSARYQKIDRLFEGVPVLLAKDGVVFKHIMRREHVTEQDFVQAMQEVNCRDIGDIQYAILETNGKIVIMVRPSEHRT